MFNEESKQQLLRLARFSIQRSLSNSPQQTFPETIVQPLKQTLACFVTLKISQSLRGCIGNMEGTESLYKSVLRNAHSAAYNDPRFNPVTEAELDIIKISISILNKPSLLEFDDESDLLSKLRKDVDGLVIESGNKRATFLPSVWEQLKTPEEFLSQLKQKAGMHKTDCPERVSIYQTISISE